MPEECETGVDDAAAERPAPHGGGQPPALSHAERIFVRINIAQTILALAGLFTGAVALYAALTESEAARRQSASSVWPYVQLLSWDSIDPGEEIFKLTMTNSGVGPARIEAVRVRLKGKTATTWGEALAGVSDDPDPRYGQMAVVGRVLSPGETVEMMSTSNPPVVRALHEIVVTGAGSVEYCYCSIFEECWLANISTGIAKPQPVDRCPDFGAESFRN